MQPPRPDWYMWRRQVRVVKKAPSRWVASTAFHWRVSKLVDGSDDLVPGIAAQNIHSTEFTNGMRNRCFDGILVGHIHGQAEHLGVRGGCDLRCRLLGVRAVAIGNDHPRSLGSKALSDGAADS